MRRLHRSKSSGDISASTPTFPTKLMRKLASKRKSKALAVASASVALSIGSPFSSTRGASIDGDTGRGRDSGWETAYAAARMAVEIARESSDMCPPLKAVVGAMFALIQNCDRAAGNAEAVKDIEQRVHSLSDLLSSPVREGDHAEKARRRELQRKLKGVVKKLEPISDQHALLGFLRNVDNAKALTGFVQELANAVTDYQVSAQQGVYERTWDIHEDTRNILEVSEVEILTKLEPVRNAGYQGGHHDECLPGTRESVLQSILLWAKTPQDQNVFWLNGVAGAGKSTIAMSISETLARDGSLGASFFCSRDYLDRRELKSIFPTLAHQLACRYPRFRDRVINIIKKDPTVAHTSLVTQLENLLVEPLSEENIPCVIVIDALDECIDDQPASAILSVLGRFAKALPLVKFFITGRPEPRIRTGFRLPLLEPLTHIFLLHEVKSTHVDMDIQRYLAQKLTLIAQRRSDVDLPNPWPSDDEIIFLTKKSSGLFIFASTIARFVESDHHEPNERLHLILSKPSCTEHEGTAGIDFLYTQILAHAFSDTREGDVFTNTRRVLGSIVLAFNPLSRRELSTILCISKPLISTTLRHLHSVVLVPTDETEKIRVFHKSFADFLQDGQRCTDPRFHVDSGTHHGEMALNCLELVTKLKKNPCSLPPFTMNQDVRNLPQLLEKRLGGGVRYACSHWARHLKFSGPPNARALADATAAALTDATPWIEVMSLENRLGEVIHSMNSLLYWLDNIADGYTLLSELATDYLRTTMYFFYPIQQSAQHVYHTAVPLSPKSSLLHKHNKQAISRDRAQTTGFINAPSNWGFLLTTISVGQRRPTSITTFAEKIAVACEDIVNIYDAVTFAFVQSLKTTQQVTRMEGSGDGSTLYSIHRRSVALWDTQTGGFINTFHTLGFEINDTAISQTDGHIACGLSDGSVAFRNAHTGIEGSVGNGRPVVTICWLSSAELVVATESSIYVAKITTRSILSHFYAPGNVWGIVVLSSDVVMVGTLDWEAGGAQDPCSLRSIMRTHGPSSQGPMTFHPVQGQTSTYHGRLILPVRVGNEVACIAPPGGVQTFSITNSLWIKPSLLEKAQSLAVSLQSNIVVQTRDSVQVFSAEVLTHVANRRLSHIHLLSKKHAVCLRTDRRLTVIELGNLQDLRPGVDILPFASLLRKSSASTRASCGGGFVAEFGISVVMQAWWADAPLPRWEGAAEEYALLGGLSPNGTRIATLYGLPRQELCVRDVTDGAILAKLSLKDDGSEGTGVAHDLAFSSETEFNLKVEGPSNRERIPYGIIASPSGPYPYTIKRGMPVPLSKPRKTPPYTLDASREWVLDGQSRKICWIPPEIMRRGNGGHFWVGTSLVMLGSDGVVRKLSFKEPDC